MNILVAVADYPNEEKVTLMYVHTRNLEYQKRGETIKVLNFKAINNYMYEGIEVISLDTFYKESIEYDILICHAPNIRNHYIFLRKNIKKFKKIVFFFHGHEVLDSNKVYSKPYDFIERRVLKNLITSYYDKIKLYLWKIYLPKIADKSYFIFVSNWMLSEFKRWVKLSEVDLKQNICITYNSVGRAFEENMYDYTGEKKYDFITIRNNLDGSKYAVDIVCKLAESYPSYNFLLIGRGEYFKYNLKPNNLEWKDEVMNHKQIIKMLNQSKCALMPTRTDSQGLMMCEMNAYGIPLITSDISVCHEIFDTFRNVLFISNENPEIDFSSKYDSLLEDYVFEKNDKYFLKNTIQKELEVFRSIVNG